MRLFPSLNCRKKILYLRHKFGNKVKKSIEIQVLSKIRKARRGTLFFAEDFVSFGSAKSVNKALERLAAKNELMRVARGVYVRPMKDSIVGMVTPTAEEVAIAIAKRDRARIIPSGSYALNQLGLSTQVPLNIIYLTDGTARKIKIGNRTITFKKTTPKYVAAIGEISRLAIQAFREIGKDSVRDEEINKIQMLLTHEKPARLEHDIRLAPAWIREIMKRALPESKHD